MNKTLRKLFPHLPFGAAMALLALLLCLVPGCATSTGGGGGGGSTNVVSAPKVTMAMLTTAAKSAAYIGGKIAVEKKPTLKPIFEDVRTGLSALIAAGSFNANDLEAILKKLPIAELKGDSGSLIIDEAVVLWDTGGRELLHLDTSAALQTYLLPFAQAVLDGLNMALGPVATNAPAAAGK